MVVEKKTTQQIHKALRKLTINDDPVLPYMVRVAKKVKDKQPEEILKYYMGGLVFANTVKLINDVDRERRKRIKKDLLDTELNKYPFFVASQHQDCAKDHLNYQGKLYVNARFLNNKRVYKYATAHNLKTVQWVTGVPVYFLTRPYCRHYFEGLSIKQVIKGNYNIPTRKIGSRQLQTPAKANLEYYQDRLKLLVGMYQKYKTEALRLKINKTKMLIDKWKHEL